MDAVQLSLDINNSLLKSFQDTTNEVLKINDKLSGLEKNLSKSSSTSDVIADNMKDVSTEVGNSKKGVDILQKGFESLKNTIKRVGSVFAGAFAFGSIMDVASKIFEIDSSIRNLSFRMGDAGKNITQFKKDIFDISSNTGMATDEVVRLYINLVKMRVPLQDVRQLAEDTANFARITGVAAESAGRLSGELSRTGRLGQEAISGLLNNIVKAQRAFGLTEESVEALTDGMIETTQILNQMGKDSQFIEHFNKGLVGMVAGFESVGLKAQDALDIVNKLLDPGQIEDNMMLYAKLGISMEDAISGNIDPQQMMEGLQGIGAELKNMSGPAAAAMARQLGIPLNQLRQMAEMDVSAVSRELGASANASAELSKSAQDQKGPLEKIQDFWNKIKNTVAATLDYVFPIVESVVEKLGGFLESGKAQQIFEKIKNTFSTIGKFLKPAAIAAAIGLFSRRGLVNEREKKTKFIFSFAK